MASTRRIAPGVLLAWAAVVLLLAARHVFWRDEVRALTLALQGDTVAAMLRALHGEGHPAVWYLLLRAAHTLYPVPQVLPVLSLGVALAAAALLLFRSPLGLPLAALFLFGRAGLYEYSVMARNYGISMLVMFAFAALYPRWRERGLGLGALLALLANCNVHSMLLAFVLLLFWGADLWREAAARRGPALRHFAANAGLLLLGAALCVATVYPPFNDAAQAGQPAGHSLKQVLQALLLPATSFEQLAGYELWRAVWPDWRWPYLLLPHLLMSALLFGSTLVLLRRPAAWLAACAALLGLSVFFSVIYVGAYRHQALWLVLLVSLRWIALATPPVAGVRRWPRLQRLGAASLTMLLALQVAVGLWHVWPIATGQAPESRSRDLATTLAARPDLADALVIADPDYLVEPLPYYLANPTYLVRERRAGPLVKFTRDARLTLSLGELLDEARRLQGQTGRPVVILLKQRLDPAGPAQATPEGYNWWFTSTPEQVRHFFAATRRLASFGAVCCSDESFDAYLLN